MKPQPQSYRPRFPVLWYFIKFNKVMTGLIEAHKKSLNSNCLELQDERTYHALFVIFWCS